jgi:hypothetical protein
MRTESPLVWFAVWASTLLSALSFGALGAAIVLWFVRVRGC